MNALNIPADAHRGRYAACHSPAGRYPGAKPWAGAPAISLAQGGRPRRHARTGFTLIELLVVIAVVALLIGILLPALASARRHGRLLACTSNLRSQGQVVLAYTADYQDALPPNALQWNRLQDDGQYMLEFWSLPRFMALYNDEPFEPDPTGDLPLVVPHGAWRCTEIGRDEDAEHTTHTAIIHSVSNAWLFDGVFADDETHETSFSANALPGWDYLSNGWRRVSEVSRPADIIALTDALTFYFAPHMHRHALEMLMQSYQVAPGTDRDNRGSHEALRRLPVSYLDGHAQDIPVEQSYWFDQQQTYAGPGGMKMDLYDREVRSLIWYVDPK